MYSRFIVVTDGRLSQKYYWIKDDESARLMTPERAVTINFTNQDTATKVAELLSADWLEFLRNPS